MLQCSCDGHNPISIIAVVVVVAWNENWNCWDIVVEKRSNTILFSPSEWDFDSELVHWLTRTRNSVDFERESLFAGCKINKIETSRTAPQCSIYIFLKRPDIKHSFSQYQNIHIEEETYVFSFLTILK